MNIIESKSTLQTASEVIKKKFKHYVKVSVDN